MTSGQLSHFCVMLSIWLSYGYLSHHLTRHTLTLKRCVSSPPSSIPSTLITSECAVSLSHTSSVAQGPCNNCMASPTFIYLRNMVFQSIHRMLRGSHHPNWRQRNSSYSFWYPVSLPMGLHDALQNSCVCHRWLMARWHHYPVCDPRMGRDIRSLQYVHAAILSSSRSPVICTADVVSDIILVALPLCLLWGVRLPSKQRIMVLSIFSTSILVSVVSVVHTLYIIPAVTFLGPLTAELGVRRLFPRGPPSSDDKSP